MRRLRLQQIGAVAILLAACSYTPTPVPLKGPAPEVAALAGTWEGTYVGTQSLRTGTIQLTIRPGSDTAFGDVLMDNQWDRQIVAADVASGEHFKHERAAQILTIQFVAIRDGFVEGQLEPYIAPDCECTVSTIFQGRRAGESISGEFFTRGAYGLYQTGTWKVRRTKTIVADDDQR